MADQGIKLIPEVKQFLKHKPESLLTTIEDKDGLITQKRRRKIKSRKNGAKIQKLQKEQQQNFSQHSKLAHKN
jgi:hypothetical protein